METHESQNDQVPITSTRAKMSFIMAVSGLIGLVILVYLRRFEMAFFMLFAAEASFWMAVASLFEGVFNLLVVSIFFL